MRSEQDLFQHGMGSGYHQRVQFPGVAGQTEMHRMQEMQRRWSNLMGVRRVNGLHRAALGAKAAAGRSPLVGFGTMPEPPAFL